MSSVVEHYEYHLAPIYSWLVGGAEVAFAHGQADLEGLIPSGGFAIDLGAGFGMHTVPLARAGWRVLAIDSSAALLQELAVFAQDLPISARRGDLLGFDEHLGADERVDLMLCMGDTLTHLETPDAIAALSRTVAARLAPGGRLIATFRDYTRLPDGDARFIPVRADEDRILTCFLEKRDGYVQVHDLLHERAGAGWTTRVSSYRKLRVSPVAVRQAFSDAGLQATVEPGPRGMVRLVADAWNGK